MRSVSEVVRTRTEEVTWSLDGFIVGPRDTMDWVFRCAVGPRLASRPATAPLLFTTRIATLWPNLDADGASAATSNYLTSVIVVM